MWLSLSGRSARPGLLLLRALGCGVLGPWWPLRSCHLGTMKPDPAQGRLRGSHAHQPLIFQQPPRTQVNRRHFRKAPGQTRTPSSSSWGPRETAGFHQGRLTGHAARGGQPGASRLRCDLGALGSQELPLAMGHILVTSWLCVHHEDVARALADHPLGRSPDGASLSTVSTNLEPKSGPSLARWRHWAPVTLPTSFPSKFLELKLSRRLTLPV